MLILPEDNLYSCLTPHQMKEKIPSQVQLTREASDGTGLVCVHVHLNIFVFFSKTKLLSIILIFVNTKISCLIFRLIQAVEFCPPSPLWF